MTQPTVSESIEGSSSPKDRLQSHQVHLTVLQAYTCIQYIHNNESKHSEMGPVRQNPIQRTVRSVHMCVHCTVHNCCTQYYTEQTPIIFPLTSRQSPLLRWCLFEKQPQSEARATKKSAAQCDATDRSEWILPELYMYNGRTERL